MSDEPNKPVADLGVTINELLRYAYAGLLPAALAAALYWDRLFKPPEGAIFQAAPSAGLVPLLVFFLAGGTVVYALHRALFGHGLFEYAHDSIHRGVFELLWNGRYPTGSGECTSKRHYLECEHGLRRHESVNVFRLLRDAVFDPKTRASFYRQHSEAVTLYVTAAVVMGADVYMWFKFDDKVNEIDKSVYHHWFCGIAAVCWIAAVSYDIAIAKQECCYLRQLSRYGDHRLERGPIVEPFGTNPPVAIDYTPLRHGLCWTLIGALISLLVVWTAWPDWVSAGWGLLVVPAFAVLSGLVVWLVNKFWK